MLVNKTVMPKLTAKQITAGMRGDIPRYIKPIKIRAVGIMMMTNAMSCMIPRKDRWVGSSKSGNSTTIRKTAEVRASDNEGAAIIPERWNCQRLGL